MKFFPKVAILLFTIMSLASCSSPNISDYKHTTPNLSLDTFFNGKLNAYGIVLDRNGKLTRRFSVDIDAQWNGNHGTINEWFVFDDGEKSTRIWEIQKQQTENGIKYTGTANDVVGEATGKTSGSALYWRYDLLIKVDGTEYQVTLDDWMYLIDQKRLFNKTDIIKFGLKVGEVILFIEKV